MTNIDYMNTKELFDYYNNSKAHIHLSISENVVKQFLDMYPNVKEYDIEKADMTLFGFVSFIFFG